MMQATVEMLWEESLEKEIFLMDGRSTVLSKVRRDAGPAWEEIASTWENSLAVLCVYTIDLNWFPAVGLYSVYIVHCTLYSVYTV